MYRYKLEKGSKYIEGVKLSDKEWFVTTSELPKLCKYNGVVYESFDRAVGKDISAYTIVEPKAKKQRITNDIKVEDKINTPENNAVIDSEDSTLNSINIDDTDNNETDSKSKSRKRKKLED